MPILDVGTKVRVINEELNTYDMEGVIVDVDEMWSHPYEVAFDGYDDLNFNPEELFKADDITIVWNMTIREASHNLPTDEENEAEDLQYIIDKIDDLLWFAKDINKQAYIKLKEAKMWLESGEDI